MIERSRVRIPAGAAGEFSSPGSTFCADSYFGIRSHPCVTAVARKRRRSFYQKRRWQVTAKHAYTLRMWLCMKWHGAWLYGVHYFSQLGSFRDHYSFGSKKRKDRQQQKDKKRNDKTVEIVYLAFTRMPGESYRRRLRSLLLCLCDVFRALINSLVCW